MELNNWIARSRYGLTTMGLALAVSATALAASPNGTWIRPNGAHVEVFDCDGGLGMKVTKSPDAAKVGKQIMCGAKSTAANRWEGNLLNLEPGGDANDQPLSWRSSIYWNRPDLSHPWAEHKIVHSRQHKQHGDQPQLDSQRLRPCLRSE